jgi:epoxyqueuosine reductase
MQTSTFNGPRHADLADELRARARGAGFDLCRIARADKIAAAAEGLSHWLETGAHGDMAWMKTSHDRRADPRVLWPEARAVVMLGMNYGPSDDPLDVLAHKTAGAISVYARNRDYHEVMKGRLKQLAGWLAAKTRDPVKVFVDTAPVMEKPIAQAAGLGWQGKHTNLVSRTHGSWLFLGSIFTTTPLPADTPEADHCGSCRACLDACPTRAFPAPYQIDARRCISYLTIEHRGHIPRELRPAIGNRIYGCDDCLAVCPWNKFAQSARETQLQARPDLKAPDLESLAELDEAAFRRFFAGGPVKRIGHAKILRNVLIAIGNSAEPRLSAAARRRLDDVSPLVRAAAAWALTRLGPTRADREGAAERLARETDRAVRADLICLIGADE